MNIFSVHIRDSDVKPCLVVVKEGFSWGAALFGFLWAPFVGAWGLAAFLLVVEGIIEIWMKALLLSPIQLTVVHLGQAVIIGLAANELRRVFLAWRGVVEADVVMASGREEAERNYLEDHPDFAARLLRAGA